MNVLVDTSVWSVALRRRSTGELRAFDDLSTDASAYECAARFFNQCRARGVQGSHIDFLICALADKHQVPIFTLDADFARYAKVCGVDLHRARN